MIVDAIVFLNLPSQFTAAAEKTREKIAWKSRAIISHKMKNVGILFSSPDRIIFFNHS
jgi:hypothetical protein